jgi:hypothetical protein
MIINVSLMTILKWVIFFGSCSYNDIKLSNLVEVIHVREIHCMMGVTIYNFLMKLRYFNMEMWTRKSSTNLNEYATFLLENKNIKHLLTPVVVSWTFKLKVFQKSIRVLTPLLFFDHFKLLLKMMNDPFFGPSDPYTQH